MSHNGKFLLAGRLPLAEFVPSLTAEQIAPLRAIMLANNVTVMEEMEKRGSVTGWGGADGLLSLFHRRRDRDAAPSGCDDPLAHRV